MSPHPQAHDVGPYLLGALRDAEHAAFEEHLTACSRCRQELDHLSGVPASLDLVPPEVTARLAHEAGLAVGVLGAEHDPPPTLLADLVRTATRHEQQRRWRVAAAVVLGAAVLVLALVLPGRLGDGAPAQQVAARLELAPVGESAVPLTATVVLEPAEWGTRIELTCRYSAAAPYAGPGAAPSGEYTLVVHGRDGTATTVARWHIAAGTDLTVPASTALPPDDIALVQLRAPDGATVLEART